MKIAVFVNKNKPTGDIETSIIREALLLGFTIDNDHPDVVFFVGGDGTFLRAVHHYLAILDQIKFLGIGNGNLGFFYDFHAEDISKALSALKNDQLILSSHPLLEGKLWHKTDFDTIYAVNEIRLENPFHTLDCEVKIDDEHLETYRGNGLVVSSSLGSSAYNKSLGGAVIQHNLPVMELTEIATIQNNFNRSLGSSLILDGQATIVLTGELETALVGYDNNVINDDRLLRLEIHQSPKVVTVLHSPDYSFIHSLSRSFVK
ncbi:MAG: NAD(+)/NADH kinase [Erysipelotrichaceae bacterium]|nr:NAD(+)/NADH kinase [Erysipelotrichaceae bacterium]